MQILSPERGESERSLELRSSEAKRKALEDSFLS